MQSPFLENLQYELRRLKGRSLVMVILVWGGIFALGLFCALGGWTWFGNSDTPPATVPSEAAVDLATATPALTLPTPTPTVLPAGATLPPLPWGDFGYGIAAHAIILPEYTMDQVAYQLGFNWVKQQVRWDHFSPGPGQMDWSGYDAVANAADERGVKLMFSVVGAPNWSRSYFDDNPQAAPPDDFALYAQFLGELVDRYKGRVHAIEIWNEQNLDREWDTAEGVNAARYVELLRLSYQTIKSRDPNIIIISGALSPTGSSATDPSNPNRIIYMDDFIYFERMIEAGFLQYTDCVGAHHNGINMPPNVAWDEGFNDPTAAFRGPFDNPNHSWSFKSTLWGYHEMIKAAGYTTPLCITEFGWATAEGFGGYPPGFEFAQDNSLQDQAEWTVEAFQLMRQWGFVRLAFLWNLDYSYKGGQGATDPNAPYSILDLEGIARPAYGALGDMPKIP